MRWRWEFDAAIEAAKALRAADTLDMFRAYVLGQPVSKQGESGRRALLQVLTNEHNVPLFGADAPKEQSRNLFDMVKAARKKGLLEKIRDKF